MWPTKLIFCMLLSILVILPACKYHNAEGKPPRPSVLAEVNKSSITEDARYLLLEGGHGGRTTPGMKDDALKDLIDRELLYQEGLKLGLDKDFKYRNAVKIMEMRIEEFKRAEMARRVMSTQIAASVNITGEDVDWYIEHNAGRLTNEFHLFILRFSEEAEAQRELARISSGTPFETLVNENVGRPMNIKMGYSPSDLGYLRLYQVPPAWREAVERLGKGEVSPVLKGKPAGYGILKLIDRRTDPKADFRGMRAAIMNELRDEKLAAAYDAYLKKLRSKATIVVYEEGGKTLEK